MLAILYLSLNLFLFFFIFFDLSLILLLEFNFFAFTLGLNIHWLLLSYFSLVFIYLSVIVRAIEFSSDRNDSIQTKVLYLKQFFFLFDTPDAKLLIRAGYKSVGFDDLHHFNIFAVHDRPGFVVLPSIFNALYFL